MSSERPPQSFEKPSIRRYQPSDLEAAKKLHRLALESSGAWVEGGPDEDMDDIENVYLNGGDFLVGFLGKDLVVMGALKKIDENTAEIKRMRVRPDLQRRGYGQMMLNKLEQRACELGYKRIILDTGVVMAGAQKLYESNGYREVRRKRKAKI